MSERYGQIDEFGLFDQFYQFSTTFGLFDQFYNNYKNVAPQYLICL